jgi:hypothetical protein
MHADDKQGCRGNGVECGDKLLYVLGTHCPLLRELGVINVDDFTQDGIVTIIKGCPLLERLDCAACCFSDLTPALRTVPNQTQLHINLDMYALTGPQDAELVYVQVFAEDAGLFKGSLTIQSCEATIKDEEVNDFCSYARRLEVLAKFILCFDVVNVNSNAARDEAREKSITTLLTGMPLLTYDVKLKKKAELALDRWM